MMARSSSVAQRGRPRKDRDANSALHTVTTPKLLLESFLPAGACLSPSNLIRIRPQGTQSTNSAFSAAPQENHLEEPERHVLYQFFFGGVQ